MVCFIVALSMVLIPPADGVSSMLDQPISAESQQDGGGAVVYRGSSSTVACRAGRGGLDIFSHESACSQLHAPKKHGDNRGRR